jgi:preprotein translocase subunit SecD
VSDATGKRLVEQGGGGSGGASGSNFARPDEVAIVYPITVRLRMPKTFERERVRFEFDDLRLWRLWTPGGTELVYRIGTKNRAAILEVMRKRLESGASFELQLSGDDCCVLRIATRDPMNLLRLKARLESPGKLEFRVTVEPAPEQLWKRFQATGERTHERARWYPVSGEMVPSARAKVDAEGRRWVLVALDEHNLTGADLEDVMCRPFEQAGCWLVTYSVKRSRQDAMSRLTAVHGNHLAMILDDAVVFAPVLNARLSDRVQLLLPFTEAQVRALTAILRAGALDVKPVLVSERPTGP